MRAPARCREVQLAARSKWRDVPELKDMDHLSFWEELHAIEAVIAGQSWLYVTPSRGTAESLRSPCSAINLNLKPKPK